MHVARLLEEDLILFDCAEVLPDVVVAVAQLHLILNTHFVNAPLLKGVHVHAPKLGVRLVGMLLELLNDILGVNPIALCLVA